MATANVEVRRESVSFPTYEPLPPDKNPMFLEKRVYQGSSGKVYPLPFYNRISDTKRDRTWQAVVIENQFIRVMVLPEIGGRIHVGEDKSNGYNFFYRQNVIKPALVGLAGPWASGGVEFNWPQHHRPATFMPVDVEIEAHPDGSKTIWMSDHDPMERMKGMHGVCLHPDRAVIELKVRAYNRTPFVQTFLWWANVAMHVHEGYQSFFPPDVAFVADHAKRATSHFPLCDGQYYGVDYARRAREGVPREAVPRKFVPPHCGVPMETPELPNYAPNDLSWYANIPVPTSYMALGSKQDFSGGYDYFQRAGLIQIADHHIAPGKKQWTWGNHEFGYAWDRNLTDNDGPYVELMLGVYTDNQPDFSFLQPGETKAWSVYWYPIQEIGPAQAANLEAAVGLKVERGVARVGVAVTRPLTAARVELWRQKRCVHAWTENLAPNRPLIAKVKLSRRTRLEELDLRVVDSSGQQLIRYQPTKRVAQDLPAPAVEPPLPRDVSSNDELYTIGLHLAQYRHATRSPTDYWEEGLRRDPGDARCSTAMGVRLMRAGDFSRAEKFLRLAIARVTSRNPNPYDGESYYQLGLTLSAQGQYDDAYDAFFKATWNFAWQSAGFHALAEIDCRRKDFRKGLQHVEESLRRNTENLRARNLRVICLRELGRREEADRALAETLRLDPLDWWARHLNGETLSCDTQVKLDLSLDYARLGMEQAAIAVLVTAKPEPLSGTAPLVEYYRAYFYQQTGEPRKARLAARRAEAAKPDYCFPARLDEIAILRSAIGLQKRDASARFYLGNLLYDRKRYDEAIALWEESGRLRPKVATVWRNLGIAYFNVRRRPDLARKAYDKACAIDRNDGRLVYERDQLWKRLGEAPARRLKQIGQSMELVMQRDDATIELCALYNQVGRPELAVSLLAKRRFQPWEGGEGLALGQYVRTHLALARKALEEGRAQVAVSHCEQALNPTENLGEARHLLANQSDLFLTLGDALAAAGQLADAREAWRRAASFTGDFQEMKVRAYSEMSYFSAQAMQRLGDRKGATKLLRALHRYAVELEDSPARIDYFATSLPTMLLFNDDIQERQRTVALFLRAQAELGLGRKVPAKRLLKQVIARDPSHAGAADLLAAL